jgi:hypothetical protein
VNDPSLVADGLSEATSNAAFLSGDESCPDAKMLHTKQRTHGFIDLKHMTHPLARVFSFYAMS